MIASDRIEDVHMFVDAPEELWVYLCVDKTNDFLAFDGLI